MKLSRLWVLSHNPQWLRQQWYLVRETLLGVSLRQPRRKSWIKPPTKPTRDIPFWLRYVLSLLIVLACVVASNLLVPPLYYRFFPEAARIEVPASLGEVSPVEEASGVPVLATPAARPAHLPPQDPSLPEGDWLSIPQIGVYTQLQQTATPGEALAKGVWVVPDYGLPGQYELPLIVAGHRFGWKWWWQNNYWRYHSFYRLPELKVGDMIEVIADQRRFVFEVYQAEEAQELSDYNANLILYTCKWLNSPVRHVRYAKLVIPETAQ